MILEFSSAATAKLLITPNQSLQPGQHSAKLIVEVREGNATSYGASIPVTFESLAARRLFPTVLTLSPKPAGQQVETQLEVPAGVAVESVAVAEEGWNAAVVGNAIQIRTKTAKTGVQTGTLTISTRTGNAKPVTQVVRILVATEGN